MQSRRKTIPLIAGIALTSMAATCFSITDPFVISVNVQDVTGTYNITQGTVNFDPSCTTKNPADYLDGNYDLISGGRLVDIIVTTVGTFGANVINGVATVNGTTIVTYNGSWASFNTPQSLLLNNTQLVRNQAGINVLLNAVQNSLPLTICHGGAFSQAAPAGLQIVVRVFAQVDATP